MRMSGAGIHDNRLRYALLRVAGIFAACLFISGGTVSLFDARISWIASAFFLFFGVVVGAIPLLYRSGKEAPSTKIIDGTYGTFLPHRKTAGAKLFAFSALALVFYAIAIGGIVRAFSGEAGSKFGIALLFALGMGTFFAFGARGALNQMRRGNMGVFLTGTHVFLLDRLNSVNLPWDEVSKIYAHWTKSPRVMQPVKNWITFERHTPSGPNSDSDAADYRDIFALTSGTLEPSTKLDLLALDPNRVVKVLNHYLHNPVDRRELGTERALTKFI